MRERRHQRGDGGVGVRLYDSEDSGLLVVKRLIDLSTLPHSGMHARAPGVLMRAPTRAGKGGASPTRAAGPSLVRTARTARPGR